MSSSRQKNKSRLDDTMKGMIKLRSGRIFYQLRVKFGDARGSLLLETVVASMVFALVGVAVLSGLGTTYIAGDKVSVQSTAENVARNQMEHVFNQPYEPPLQTPYPTYSGVPTDFSVTTLADEVDPLSPDPDIERITVTVAYNGADVVTVNTLRFNEPP